MFGPLASFENERAQFWAVDLGYDQRPVCADKKLGVRAAGECVFRLQQIIESLRALLSRDLTSRLAMTQSVGDTDVSEHGVIPEAVIVYFTASTAYKFIALASNGVF